MGEWQEISLGDLIDVKHGFAFKGEFFQTEPNNIILTTPGNFKIGGGWKEDKCKYYNGDIPEDYILKGGELVVTMTDLSKEVDTLGYSAIIPKKTEKTYLHNQRIGLVEFINDEIDKKYLYWLMRDKEYRWHVVSSASGSTVSHTSPTRIEEYEFLLPPLPEQRAIASVLSSLDDKIDLLHRQNKTLEALAETLFRQWFVEEADEGWEEGKLGELMTITRGASPRPIVQYVKNGTVPWIKIADATGSNSFYINSTKEFIIEEGVSKSVQVFPGDLILSNSATCGLPFFVELEGCIHDGWLLFRDFSVLSKFFVFFFLKQINRELNNVADGSVQNNLNTGILKEYELKVPSEDTLKKFDESVIPIINKMKSNNNQISTLEKLRATLLPKLMSGEVRVAG